MYCQNHNLLKQSDFLKHCFLRWSSVWHIQDEVCFSTVCFWWALSASCMLREFCGINQCNFLYYFCIFHFEDVPGAAVAVDVSSVSDLAQYSTCLFHIPDIAVRFFSFLYLACIKRPTLLWRWKEPNGSKWMQNQPQRDVQLTTVLKLTVIYYNFHYTLIVKVIFFIKAAHVMRNIPGIKALGRRIWVVFMATHCLSVKMKTGECGMTAVIQVCVYISASGKYL